MEINVNKYRKITHVSSQQYIPKTMKTCMQKYIIIPIPKYMPITAGQNLKKGK